MIHQCFEDLFLEERFQQLHSEIYKDIFFYQINISPGGKPGGKGPGAETGTPVMGCGTLFGIWPGVGLTSSVTSGFSPPICLPVKNNYYIYRL